MFPKWGGGDAVFAMSISSNGCQLRSGVDRVPADTEPAERTEGSRVAGAAAVSSRRKRPLMR